MIVNGNVLGITEGEHLRFWIDGSSWCVDGGRYRPVMLCNEFVVRGSRIPGRRGAP